MELDEEIIHLSTITEITMSFTEIPPNNTIYLRNLNEKMKPDKLKRQLYKIFSKFGKILDIVAKDNMKMRGQAFVVFQDLNSAVSALKQMQDFDFLGKPMKIQFAKRTTFATTVCKFGKFTIGEKC
jgi:U2 small nuclear ribonucleoprotein B''